MLAARCRVVADKAGPTAHELLMEQVGGSGMMKPHIRVMCADILKRLGVVQLQSVHEKYDKAFDKLTLTEEERFAL